MTLYRIKAGTSGLREHDHPLKGYSYAYLSSFRMEHEGGFKRCFRWVFQKDTYGLLLGTKQVIAEGMERSVPILRLLVDEEIFCVFEGNLEEIRLEDEKGLTDRI